MMEMKTAKRKRECELVSEDLGLASDIKNRCRKPRKRPYRSTRRLLLHYITFPMGREGAGSLQWPRNSGLEILAGLSSQSVSETQVWRGPIRFRPGIEGVLLWECGKAKKIVRCGRQMNTHDDGQGIHGRTGRDILNAPQPNKQGIPIFVNAVSSGLAEVTRYPRTWRWEVWWLVGCARHVGVPFCFRGELRESQS
jgi:hypothetical protein